MVKEAQSLIKSYQNLISAVVISVSMLTSVFMFGRYVERLADQHNKIIETQETIINNEKDMLKLYLQNCGK